MTLTVTEQAAAALKQFLDTQDHEAGEVLRLVSDGEGNHGFSLDIPRAEDHVVQHQGEVVMVIEPAVSDSLADNILDLQESPSGASLTLYR